MCSTLFILAFGYLGIHIPPPNRRRITTLCAHFPVLPLRGCLSLGTGSCVLWNGTVLRCSWQSLHPHSQRHFKNIPATRYLKLKTTQKIGCSNYKRGLLVLVEGNMRLSYFKRCTFHCLEKKPEVHLLLGGRCALGF